VPYIIRKITRSKWDSRAGLAIGETPADVAADLRTTENKLSVWLCNTPPDHAEGDDIVLALATAGDRIDRVDIAWVDRVELEQLGLPLVPSPGRTPVTDLQSQHEDVVRLDIVRLGALAKVLERAIQNNQVRRVSAQQVTKLIRSAIERQRLRIDHLPEGMRAKLSG
jgi:hypothetical protein